MRLQNEMPTMNFSQDAGAEQGNGNSRLTMIEGVDYLINEVYSIYEIAKILHTTTRSVGAYKAHITRRKKIAMPQISQLEKYLHDTYVVIPTGLIHEKLQNGQKKNLADILDTLFGEGLEKKTKEGVGKGELYSVATILTRDLVNEQAAFVTPTYLADLAVSIAKTKVNFVCV